MHGVTPLNHSHLYNFLQRTRQSHSAWVYADKAVSSAVIHLNIVCQYEALSVSCKVQSFLWLCLQAGTEHQTIISELVHPGKNLSELHVHTQLKFGWFSKQMGSDVPLFQLAFRLLRNNCTIGTCSEGSHLVATQSAPSTVLGASCRRSKQVRVVLTYGKHGIWTQASC